MFTSYSLATVKRLLSSRCSRATWESTSREFCFLPMRQYSHLTYHGQAKLSDVTTIAATTIGDTKIAPTSV
jgi:hypothetical protein